MARDLHCRRHGRPVTFANISWRFVASDGWLALGFEAPPGADIDTYERCMGARVETSMAQAMVWLAEDVQYELTGYEFVQWPAAGKRVLEPRLVEDHAVWTEPGTDTIVAPIGELCTAPASPHLM